MVGQGALVAGAKLNELALASKLRVSRTALREAVRGLERAGLVTIIPNRGVFVRTIGRQDLSELFDVHAGLARTAGRLLAQRATDAQLRRLEASHGEMAAAFRDGSADRYRALNARFHDDLFALSGNARLEQLHASASSELNLSGQHNLAHPWQMRASAAEHRRIIQAAQAREPERTARAFERHLLAGRLRMPPDAGAPAVSARAGPKAARRLSPEAGERATGPTAPGQSARRQG